MVSTTHSYWYACLSTNCVVLCHTGLLCYLLAGLTLSLLNDDELHWFLRFLHSFSTHGLPDSLLTELLAVYRQLSTLHFSLSQMGGLVPVLLEYAVVCPALAAIFVAQLADVYSLFRRTRVVNTVVTYLEIMGDTLHDEQSTTAGGAHLYMGRPLRALASFHTAMVHTFCLGSNYGLFAQMTRVRNELAVEVSDDGAVWQPVEFRYKPGSGAALGPKLVTPFFHLPRLDRALWFLPQLGGGTTDREQYPRWFWVLLISILEGNRDVLSLLHPHSAAVIGSVIDRYKQPTAAREIKPLRWVRVSLDNYSKPHVESRHRAIQSTSVGVFWRVVRIEEVLPAATVEELKQVQVMTVTRMRLTGWAVG